MARDNHRKTQRALDRYGKVQWISLKGYYLVLLVTAVVLDSEHDSGPDVGAMPQHGTRWWPRWPPDALKCQLIG